MAAAVQVSREIAASADEVWAAISDVTRMGEWSPETTSCDWRGDADGPALGARFVGRNRSGWHRWSTSCEVVACEPGRSFAFDVTSGPIAVARWAYEIQPTDDGCRITERWVDQRNSLFAVVSRAVTGVADRAEHSRRGMEQTLEGLAAAVESHGAPGR